MAVIKEPESQSNAWAAVLPTADIIDRFLRQGEAGNLEPKFWNVPGGSGILFSGLPVIAFSIFGLCRVNATGYVGVRKFEEVA